MNDHFHIRLEKESLVFSAAHFITYGDNICERLHGHNYRVFAEVAGALDANHYVVDFIEVLEKLRTILHRLDHRVLLPADHPTIHVTTGNSEVLVRFENRRWIFPANECVILPVSNTTAESLARVIALELVVELQKSASIAMARLDRLTVGVDENYGQWAIFEHAIAAGPLQP